MANYASLKAAIQEVVKTNGNKEITGALLQQSLLAMINSLGAGYQYAGIATPSTNPGTPDQNVFYLASTAGTYTNFGGIVLADGEIAILKYNGAWSKDSSGAASLEKVNQLGQNIDSVGQNYVLGASYYSDGGLRGAPDWFAAVDFIPVKTGDVVLWNPGLANYGGYMILYDSAKNKLDDFSANATERTITISDNSAAFIRPSFAIANMANAKLVVNGKTVWIPSENNVGLSVALDEQKAVLGSSIGKYVPFYFMNGTISNPANATIVTLRGRNTLAIPVSPNHKYRILSNSAPHDGYNYYFQLVTFSTDSPGTLSQNQIRNWIDQWDKAFSVGDTIEINESEYGIVLLMFEQTLKSASGTRLPLRESNFDLGDICIIDVSDSSLEGIYEKIQEQEMATVACSSTIMTALSDARNVVFGANSLTIKTRGFSFVAGGVQYNITGTDDFLFEYYSGRTRRYLCINIQALMDGKRNFSDVIQVFNEVAPSKNFCVLLCTYIGLPQSGIFFHEYLRNIQNADTIGAQSLVDYLEKGKDFSALFASAVNAVSFLFFTDPHTGKGGGFDFFDTHTPMLKIIQQYYQSLPFDFVLSGGDWLNNSDTQAMACYKLGNIKQQLKTRLSPCYQMLGNHDTNYQGVALPQDAINSLMFNDFGKSYYRVEQKNCALYVFDSGTDGRTVLSSYEKEQLNWFASTIYAEQKDNIIIASHIIIEGSQSDNYISTFATAIEQIAEAYNNRGSVTIDGISYIFTGVTGNGRIRCFIGGHTHFDYVNTEQPIPIFITLNTIATTSLSTIFGDGVKPRFDMILIDFSDGKLHAIRVGDGENRTIDLA